MSSNSWAVVLLLLLDGTMFLLIRHYARQGIILGFPSHIRRSASPARFAVTMSFLRMSFLFALLFTAAVVLALLTE